MNCPNCGTNNSSVNRFCLKCGQALTLVEAARTPVTPPALPISQPIIQSPAPSPTSLQQPVHPGNPPRSPESQSSVGVFSIWGPFAGYGARRRHVGWLMNGVGHRATELRTRVGEMFRDRQIPGVYPYETTLGARGVLIETRRYFILRRGLVVLALYIAQFGRDLFISQVSYLKPPISNARVFIVIGLLLFQIYMTVFYTSAVGGMLSSYNVLGGNSSSALSDLVFMLCLVGPLGSVNTAALLLLVIFSVYKWLTQRDFWAALRVPPNEFNEDDLMALEHAVEETVRQAMTAIHMNPNDLKEASPSQSTQLF